MPTSKRSPRRKKLPLSRPKNDTSEQNRLQPGELKFLVALRVAVHMEANRLSLCRFLNGYEGQAQDRLKIANDYKERILVQMVKSAGASIEKQEFPGSPWYKKVFWTMVVLLNQK